MAVVLNPNSPPDSGESPGLGASRIRALTQAFLDLFNLPANVSIPTPLTITRVGPLTNRTGGGLVFGDIVGLDPANNTSVVLADTQAAARPYVVALDTIADSDPGVFGQVGQATVRVTGAVTRGNYLRKSATSLALEDAGVAQTSPPPSGALGLALTAAAGPGAGTVTALLWGASVGGVGSVNLIPTASAAANRATLQAAIDALPAAGGTLQITTYGNHIDAAINVSKPLKIVGPGTTEVSTPGTFVLYLDTVGQTGFNVTSQGPFNLQDLSIRGAAGTTHVYIDGPAGPGVHTGTHWVRIDNCVFYEGAIFVDFQASVFFAITRSGFFGHTAAAIKIQNLHDGDQGDSFIGSGCVFSTTPANDVYGVLYVSGGGMKITGNKFLGGGAGIAVNPASTATDPNTISDIIIADNSFEVFAQRGIFLTRAPGVTLSIFNVQILGNQIASAEAGALHAISMGGADGSDSYGAVLIADNVITNCQNAFQIRRVDAIDVRGNLISLAGGAGVIFDVDTTCESLRIGENTCHVFTTFMTGTPGGDSRLLGGSLPVAQLPPVGSGMCYASDALGAGEGGYTHGMVATGGGLGSPVWVRSGVGWRA